MYARLHTFLIITVLLATATPARSQFLMVVDSSNDRVMLFDANDGSLVNATFIVDDPTSAQYDFQTPKDAIQVGDQVWVSDQLSDAVYRFDLNGTFVGAITGGMDNIRGMELVGNIVYVTNAGTANGAPGAALVRFDTNGTPLGSFPVVSSPFDVIGFQGDLLVCSSDKDTIERYTTGGTFLGTFHNGNPGGIQFPEQMLLEPNGHVLAAGFSSPIGLYEYDSTGAQVSYHPVGGGNRGVARLGNGLLIYTDNDSVHAFDPATGTTTALFTKFSGHYINPLNLAGAPSIYCTAKVNSAGCTPAIAFQGAPSAGAGSGFVLSASQVLDNKFGVVFYSKSGPQSVPFQGGTLCCLAPLVRTPLQSSGGTHPCGGIFSFDFNAYIASGKDPFLVAGQQVWGQYWSRDPGFAPPNNTNLTNAIEFTIQP